MLQATNNLASRRNRRGFTFIELMLGLMVTALVMAALAALLAAVAQGWKESDTTQSSVTQTAQVHLRLQRTLKSACLIGAVRTGAINGSGQGAAMLIWKNDANGDWRIQFSEVELIEYHGSSSASDPSTLRVYQVNWPVGYTAEQKALADFTLTANDDLYVDAEIDSFRNLANVDYTVLARHVSGCTFRKSDVYTSPRPSAEYLVKIQIDDALETIFGTASLRTPATLPASQR